MKDGVDGRGPGSKEERTSALGVIGSLLGSVHDQFRYHRCMRVPRRLVPPPEILPVDDKPPLTA